MFRVGGSYWLTPGEQEETIAELIAADLLKWDNRHNLPLKSGGNTDIYVNLRNMRSNPSSIRYLAKLFANPLHRLCIDRFVEVPEAVSPLAGAISVCTDIPMVTVREEAKAGRVVSGVFIGDIVRGDRTAIIDDVVTDGASKIPGLTALRSAGVDVAAMVVLVDRQQGWKKKLFEAGFADVPVWPAMTLHDVRKYLIGNDLMQRCDKVAEEKNPIIVALDGKDWEDILPVIDQLRTSGCILKVNDLLLARGMEWILPNLSVYGRVMADLKGHDIKNTIENICRSLKKYSPWAITVHASGGEGMIKTAVSELKGTGTLVLAVTVLTSISPQTCEEIYTRLPPEQVMKLAEIANRVGVNGFVCSPEEVGMLSSKFPGKIFVTPAVRSPGQNAGDQIRVATPREAKDWGATHVVMGRQILGAEDPVAEVKRVMKDELSVGI